MSSKKIKSFRHIKISKPGHLEFVKIYDMGLEGRLSEQTKENSTKTNPVTKDEAYVKRE